MRRRDFLILPAAALVARAGLGQTRGARGEMRLWYRQPAANWNEALPIGNGRLGAMVFGKTDIERIQLNEETVWSGSAFESANPEALENLPKVRQLLFDGKPAEAFALAEKKLMARPLRMPPYQTL